MATQVTMWEIAGGQLYRTRQEAVDAEDKEGLLKAFQDFGATSVIATDKAATPNAEAPVQAAPAVVPGATSGALEANGLKPRKTLQEARTDAALDKQVRENGEVLTRRQWVERKVAEGLKTKVTQEDRIKPMSRMAYFRANNEEQRAHDRKVKEAGKKDVFWIGDYEVTKTEHDYANALTDKAAVLLTDPASGFPYRAVLTVKPAQVKEST